VLVCMSLAPSSNTIRSGAAGVCMLEAQHDTVMLQGPFRLLSISGSMRLTYCCEESRLKHSLETPSSIAVFTWLCMPAQ
jgi:hypothetical protein